MVDNIGSKADSMSQIQGPSNASASSSSSQGLLREQDWLLPIANVGRIMKQTLPPNAKISKEAKETMQECVSEFISFVTGEASDKCHKEKRKTVNGDDICWALSTLGFDDYVEPMKAYLHRYREVEGEKSSSANPNRANGGGGVDELRLFRDDENALRSLGTSSSTLMFDASDRNNRSNLRQF